MHGCFHKSECFLIGIFWRIKSKKSVFNILDRKEYFLDQTSEVLKRSEKSKCSKGVSLWFLFKNGMFSHWYFLIFWIEKNVF